MSQDDTQTHLTKLADLENLADSLADRTAGDLFRPDLEEARDLALHDRRFAPLVDGLAAGSLGERMAAVNRFFKSLDPGELATLELPQHLGQLRAIFLSSR